MMESSFIIQFCNTLLHSHFLCFFRWHLGLNSNSAFMSCMDEKLRSYSAFVWHIHRKLPGLIREERCFLHSPSIPQKTGLGLIQYKGRLQVWPGEQLLRVTAHSSGLSEIASQRLGEHGLGSPGGLGISFPFISAEDGERERIRATQEEKLHKMQNN